MVVDPLQLAPHIALAERRIRPYVRTTPVERSPALERPGDTVHLKLENTQLTGSFKIRGAFNKLLDLDPETRARGVVAASTGNHGMAVACAAQALGCAAIVFAPETAASSKIDGIRGRGAEVRQVGDDGLVAERAAREYAETHGLAYVSPYNDLAVIAGQGTIAIELEAQLAAFDVVYIALGGGGLLSGIAAWLASVRPEVEIVACSPENSAVLHHSMAAGRILELTSTPTLSDGTAGGVEPGAVTFDLCQRFAHRSLLVSEAKIEDALRLVIGRHHTLIEGAAAVAVAGLSSDPGRQPGQRSVAILCGANIDPAVLRQIL